MSDNQDALQMADELDSLCDPYDSAIAAELRRLHAENEQLRTDRDNLQIEMLNLKGDRVELMEALRKCDEAMAWDLGGEPMDTLMVNARNAARAALAKATTQGESK